MSASGERQATSPGRQRGGTGDLLSRRALNRATLARQLLLARAALSATEAVEHLVGMQAQAPSAPYVGLWSRLEGFLPDALATPLAERQVVRASLMRATIHLVTVRDWLTLRPLTQSVLVRSFSSTAFARNVAGVDLDELLAMARVFLEERPRTRAQLGPLLRERWPDRDAESLAYAVTSHLPLVQVPPRGLWGTSGPPAWTTAESWLGHDPDLDVAAATLTSPHGVLDEMVLRYLGAFGPASVRDVQTWSGLTRLREVVDRLRPRLRTFCDEHGTELFDLPDAPRPDSETPAPPRFLPEFDNILLSHADRSRVIVDARRPPLFPGNGGVMGTLLVDGLFQATWRIVRQGGAARLVITPFTQLPSADLAAISGEGTRLLAFAAADAAPHDVGILPPALTTLPGSPLDSRPSVP
jgi:hypothetical protein